MSTYIFSFSAMKWQSYMACVNHQHYQNSQCTRLRAFSNGWNCWQLILIKWKHHWVQFWNPGIYLSKSSLEISIGIMFESALFVMHFMKIYLRLEQIGYNDEKIVHGKSSFKCFYPTDFCIKTIITIIDNPLKQRHCLLSLKNSQFNSEPLFDSCICRNFNHSPGISCFEFPHNAWNSH